MPRHHRALQAQHVIDRIDAGTSVPVGRRLVRIGDHRTDLRRVQPAECHGRVNLPCKQHRPQVLSGTDPLHIRRIGILGDVGILLGHPGDVTMIDAIVVAQDAAQPHAGGL